MSTRELYISELTQEQQKALAKAYLGPNWSNAFDDSAVTVEWAKDAKLVASEPIFDVPTKPDRGREQRGFA